MCIIYRNPARLRVDLLTFLSQVALSVDDNPLDSGLHVLLAKEVIPCLFV